MKYKVELIYQTSRSYYKSADIVETETKNDAVEMLMGRVMLNEWFNNQKTPKKQRYFRLCAYKVEEVKNEK